MNFKYRIISLLSLLIVFTGIRAQQIEKSSISDVSENIKLNTDRDLYFCGDNIYFNADYFIDEHKTVPVLSNVLYIELIDCNNNIPIIQKKFKITDFNVNGSLNIPKEVVSGNYILRAYTQYQRNFSDNNYGFRLITIFNPISNLSQSSYINNDSIYIAAEGNILLNNSKNNIIIKVPDNLVFNNNKYLITDESNNVIKEFTPDNSGFYSTAITINNLNQYKLLIIKENSDTIKTNFPKIQNTGIQTNIQSTKNNIFYKIRTEAAFYSIENNEYRVKAFSNDFIENFTESISFKDSLYDLNINPNVLSKGINYIVLLDAEENILKINSIYKLSNPVNDINIELNKDTFEPREKIELKVSAKEISLKELPLVSISVTRNGTKKEDHSFTPSLYLKNHILLENFLNTNNLTSDIQGQIMVLYDNAIDYELFKNKIKKTTETNLEYIPEVRDLTISGMLRNKVTKEPIPNHNVYLSVLFNSPQFHINKTQENGEFIFSLNNVQGTNDIFLCSETFTEAENQHELLIKSSFSSDIPSFDKVPIFIDYKEKELIEQLYLDAQIQEKFNSKSTDINDNNITESIFNLNDNKITVNPNDYIDLETFQELFYEIVPHVMLKKLKDQYYFKVLDENDYMLVGTPLVIVDRIPIFDPNKVVELDPSQIKKIEIIYKTYILGSHTINGVIMITTNTDNFADIKLPESATFLEYQTLENKSNSSFLNENKTDSSKKIPNFRTTLYWNPQLELSNEAKDIQFNATDRKGTYDIVVKGYNSNGQFFYGKNQITIK
ncbi:MAG: hypothetical protein GQ564_19360 [Bacteroidales bacterium]|nr:hypothetical protein [Bacteroidales bacterium]